MNRPVLPAMFLVLSCLALNTTPAAEQPDLPIVASNLLALEVPGKITGVLWTRRGEFFTLQVLIPRSRAASRPMPRIEAWLELPDGTRIEPARQWQSRDCADRTRVARCVGSEIEYSFSATSARQAVAAVLRVDEEMRKARLTPFPD